MLEPSAVGLRFSPGRAEARANCPFCGDRGGHLYGNAQKGVFFCFRCGARGRLRAGAVVLSARPAPQVSAPAVADAAKLDAVYRALLAALGLSAVHREHLLSPARGLDPEQIQAGMYRTLPESGRAELGERVAARADPAGVPGFWRAGGKWRVAGPPGLLVPVRDASGRIVGLQVRRDASGGGPRYVWLSSAGRPGGTPARALCHVSALGPPGGPRVWITEGPLKADIAASRLGEPVLAVPGVNTWRSAGLFEALEALGAGSVVVAFDADAETNPHVDAAARGLAKALRDAGCRAWRAFWPVAWGKGLDDLLLGGRFPELQEAKGGMCLNRVTLAGEVVQPPAVSQVKRKDGSSCLKARLLFEISDDGRREVVPINAWDRLAKRVQEAGLSKGDYLIVDGKLKVSRDEAGRQLEIWLSDFSVLLKSNGHHQPAQPDQAPKPAPETPAKKPAVPRPAGDRPEPPPPPPPPPPADDALDVPLEEVELPW